jgi:hypothetical protein
VGHLSERNAVLAMAWGRRLQCLFLVRGLCERGVRYGAVLLPAWRKTASPGCARCSFKRKPGGLPPSKLVSVALRLSIDSRRMSVPSSSNKSKRIERALTFALTSQSLEHRESLVVARHRLAVDEARPHLERVHRLHDQRIARTPVMSAAVNSRMLMGSRLAISR